MATICFTKISSEIKKGKTLSDFIERSGIFSFYCFDPGVSFNKLKEKKKYKRRICIFCVCLQIHWIYLCIYDICI